MSAPSTVNAGMEAQTEGDPPDEGSKPPDEHSKQDPVPPRRRWVVGALFAGLLCVALVAAVAGALLLGSRTNDRLAPAAFATSVLFLIAGIAFPLGMVKEANIRQKEDSDCDRDCKELKKALKHIDDRTLRGLAQANFKQMRTFTVIAQRQARMSYNVSLVASAASLAVLISGAAVASGLVGTPAKVAAGTLTVVGAALSGFLAVVFLRTYSMASRQMSFYYGQPLVHCYLLHAEWLTSMAKGRFDKETEFLLWKEVVRASIKASCNAQNHLLSIQVTNPAWRDPGATDDHPVAESAPVVAESAPATG